MARKPTRTSATRASKKAPEPKKIHNGIDSSRNELLRDLPADERKLVFSKLELVSLKIHDVLHEAGATLRFGYFPTSGIVSMCLSQRARARPRCCCTFTAAALSPETRSAPARPIKTTWPFGRCVTA